MHSADDSDVWAPPNLSLDIPVVGDGSELVYDMSDTAFRREARAWLRATRWYASLWFRVVIGQLIMATVVFWMVVMPLPAAVNILIALLLLCLLLLAFYPHRLAASMARRRMGRTESRVTLEAGSIVMESPNRLSVPLVQLSDIRERADVYWLLFDKRLAIFVSKSPRIGDARAFMRMVREVADAPPVPSSVADAGVAQAAFRPPSRLVHIARSYAVALRSPLFLVLVVFAAVALVGGIAAIPWQVSQILVWPLLALSGSLVFLLCAPAMRIAFAGRDALGKRGSVTVWTACEDHLRMDSSQASARIGWTDVKRVRRIGRFGLLELLQGRFILAESDAASGDPAALLKAIEDRAGGQKDDG